MKNVIAAEMVLLNKNNVYCGDIKCDCYTSPLGKTIGWEYTNPSEILFLAISVPNSTMVTERKKEKKLPEKLRKHRRNLFLFTFAVVKYASGNSLAFAPSFTGYSSKFALKTNIAYEVLKKDFLSSYPGDSYSNSCVLILGIL